MRLIIIIFSLINCLYLQGQPLSGKVLNKKNNQPIEFVNIGIIGKNIGTISDMQGNYQLFITPGLNDDTLMFSCIGYYPYMIRVSDFLKLKNEAIVLEEQIYDLNEVIVKPKDVKEKRLGATTNSKMIVAGFIDNNMGYECGILMNNKKTAFIKKVNANIALCTYDTIFYRLNIYKVTKEKQFENILKEPIYINLSKDQVKNKVSIDLQEKNIVVEGDFLVTFEHIKNLGEGSLYFCAGLTKKTHYRKTSQGNWETQPAGIAISVVADIEK